MTLEEFAILRQKTVNFLMGKVMQATQGKANPALVKQLILERLDAE